MSLFKKLFLLTLLIGILFSLSSTNILSKNNKDNLPSITIINLIRSKELGHENDNLLQSLKDQWQVTKDTSVNATWLLQYSVLEDNQMINFAKQNMKNQEFGLLFEIDKNFAQKSNVSYRGQGPSYFSDGLLLSSYDTSERKRLIDTAFKEFKEKFGYYPKTVGAWYIGADSLNYMQQKYHIVASLKASDQFNLDMYTVWGSPWSTPYLSSSKNQLIPAESYEESSKVVNLQWAARDPNHGYNDPLFSVQDFGIKGYSTDYIDYLSSIFLKSKSDNLVFGLENGGDLKVFEKYYKTIISKAKDLENLKKIKITLAKDFANQFLLEKQSLPGTSYFLTNDYKSDSQSFWYSTTYYRVYIQKIKENIYLVDVRNYSDKVKEDYFSLNNSQGEIRASSPEVLDSILFPNKTLFIQKSNNPLILENNKNKITIKSGTNTVGTFSTNKFTINKNGKEILYDYSKKSQSVNIFYLLLILSIGYFSFSSYIFKKTLISASIFIPLFFSIPFLSSGLINSLTFVFDKKELVILSLFGNPMMLSNINIILFCQILPFTLLIIFNLLYVWKKHTAFKFVYLLLFSITTLLFAHLTYFPLDKTALKSLLVLLGLFGLLSLIVIWFIYKFKKSKQLAFKLTLILLFFVCSLSITIFFSRTKILLNNFELQALWKIKNYHKDVIYVSQVDYNIKPIYKAVKPFLYENISTAEKLTNTHWTNVLRPQDNVLKLSDYKNKLILIPRYLGSDLSKYEEKTLGLIKIFDNYQIAIYEKK